MKSDRIFDAIGMIDDRYIVSAQGRLGAGGTTKQKIDRMGGAMKRKTMIRSMVLRRFLPFAAAMVFLLVFCFSTAMVVNADFRNAVFRFFHIPTAETVPPREDEAEQPDNMGDIEYIGSKNIEGMVDVEYVRVNGNVVWSDGVIRVASYEEETAGQILGTYALQNGRLAGLEPHTERLEYTWDGETLQISFEWYENDGRVCAYTRNPDTDSDKEWSVQAADGESDFVIITVSRGAQIEYTSRPLLYDLRTKEVTDVFEGCEILESEPVNEFEFSPDLSRMLLGSNYGSGSSYYYYDVAGRTLKPLDELIGMEVYGAWFVDDDTICCVFEREDGTYTCRAYSTPSWESFEIYAGLPEKKWNTDSGLIFTGGRYGLFVDEEHNTFVYDCKTGERAVVEGFRYSPDAGTMLNKAGDKILISLPDSDAPGLGISQIGVLDLEKRLFTLLDREGSGERFEGSMGWFDNDRVVIQAYKDAKPSVGIQYLYIYTIK